MIHLSPLPSRTAGFSISIARRLPTPATPTNTTLISWCPFVVGDPSCILMFFPVSHLALFTPFSFRSFHPPTSPCPPIVDNLRTPLLNLSPRWCFRFDCPTFLHLKYCLPEVPYDNLQLFCWAQASNSAFEVKISAKLTVSYLKEEIIKKNPHAFGEVDSATITLWKASLSYSRFRHTDFSQRWK